MGKRGRARGKVEKLSAPESEYASPQGDVLVAARRADAQDAPPVPRRRCTATCSRRRTPGSARSSCSSSAWPCAGWSPTCRPRASASCCMRLPRRHPGRAALDPRRPARAPAPSTSPTSRRREPRLDPAAFADLLAGYCLDVQPRRDGARALDLARRAAAARAAARDPRARRLAAAARRAARADARLLRRTRATATSTTTPTSRSPRPRRSTRCSASRRPPTSASSPASTPTASRATPARGARSARRR